MKNILLFKIMGGMETIKSKNMGLFKISSTIIEITEILNKGSKFRYSCLPLYFEKF